MGMTARAFLVILCPLFLTRRHIKMALIGQAISEKMFESSGHIHVNSPGTGADNPWGHSLSKTYIFFQFVFSHLITL